MYFVDTFHNDERFERVEAIVFDLHLKVPENLQSEDHYWKKESCFDLLLKYLMHQTQNTVFYRLFGGTVMGFKHLHINFIIKFTLVQLI